MPRNVGHPATAVRHSLRDGPLDMRLHSSYVGILTP
jgi:hypothetical protein